MACYHPLKGFRARSGVGGSRPIVFNVQQGFADRPVIIACGQCIGCRLERSRQWAVRCLHEARMHDCNSFITLTYSDDNLPPGRSLVLDDFQRFMKRLRFKFGAGIRFFHCGEYGEQYGRPHYHACLFNMDFPDKVIHRVTRNGDTLYTSRDLDDLWSLGFATIGEVTFESAAYVARYVMKKRTGVTAQEWYEFVDEDGVVWDRKPEYVTMSRRPGIGSKFVGEFLGDIYPDDFVLVNGKKARPPRFYDGIFEVAYPSDFKRVKRARVVNAKDHESNNTPDRLKVRERIQSLKLERLKREME